MVYGLMILVLLSIPTTFADDEFEEEDEINERSAMFEELEEREEEEEIEENIGGGIANIILYITIAAVAGTVGYVLWKIVKMKRAKA